MPTPHSAFQAVFPTEIIIKVCLYCHIMAGDPFAGLQYLQEIIEVAVDSEPARTSAVLANAYAGITRSFLCKIIVYQLYTKSFATGENFLIFVGPNGASVGEMDEALENELVDPTDPSNSVIPAQKTRLIWKSIRLLGANKGQLAVEQQGGRPAGSGYISLGDGIPFGKDHGPICWNYNPSASPFSANSQVIGGMITYYGVWLDDQ